MFTLYQHLAQLDRIELRVIAQNQGILLEDDEEGDLSKNLAEQMLRPEHVQDVWEDLNSDTQQAVAQLLRNPKGMPAPVFQRRFGELRRIGPGRLATVQPWKQPTGPSEVLWYLGWITRGFRETAEGVLDIISIPTDLAALIPLSEDDLLTEAKLPAPEPAPAKSQELGQLLLDDLGTLLAYVQNHQVWLRDNGRWRIKDLNRLTPRLRLSSIRRQPLEAGGPLHLIFFAAKKLGLLEARQRRQKFGRALRPWLEQSRWQQMASLFDTWSDAADWNDLCLTPGLHCQKGAWRNDPVLARQALLHQLQRTQPGQWYGLDDFTAFIYENLPDFQRPDGLYDTWYIQNGAGEFLRGFEHWPAVEGRLIRYIWQGPLFWLGVLAWDDAMEIWSLTAQGERLLDKAPAAPESSPAPILRIQKDFTIILAPHIGLWDRLRVALFSFWQASEPEYRYLITRRGLRRARQRGVSTQRILEFLHRASGGEIPENVRRALDSSSS